MPVGLSQYRGAKRFFSSQFVPYKQYNFFYSDSKIKYASCKQCLFLNIHIYVYEVSSSKWSTLYVFIKKEY